MKKNRTVKKKLATSPLTNSRNQLLDRIDTLEERVRTLTADCDLKTQLISDCRTSLDAIDEAIFRAVTALNKERSLIAHVKRNVVKGYTSYGN